MWHTRHTGKVFFLIQYCTFPGPGPPIHTAEDWPGWSCFQYTFATRKQSKKKSDLILIWPSFPLPHLHTSLVWVEDNKCWGCQVQVVFLGEVLCWLEGSPAIRHVWAAGVGGAALLPVVHHPGLLEHEEAVPVVPVTLGQHQREQELEDDLAVINWVSGNVGDKPVPELGQGP